MGEDEDRVEYIYDDMVAGFPVSWAMLSEDARTVLAVASRFTNPRVSTRLIARTLTLLGRSAPVVDGALRAARRLAIPDGYHLYLEPRITARVRAQGPLPGPVRRALLAGLRSVANDALRDGNAHAACAALRAYALDLSEAETADLDGPGWQAIGDAFVALGTPRAATAYFRRAALASALGDRTGSVDEPALASELEAIAVGHYDLAQFAEAMPWFQRAAAIRERRDAAGRIDGNALGFNLYHVGACLVRLRHADQAIPWLLDAAAAAGTGDVRGRVDRHRVGKSLHQLALCYAVGHRHAEALGWLARAVAAIEQGDAEGVVHFSDLGSSLCEVGRCHMALGQPAVALRWLQRAVAAAERGRLALEEVLLPAMCELAFCHVSLGRSAQALPWLERVAAVRDQIQFASDPGYLFDRIGACYRDLGRHSDALLWWEHAVGSRIWYDARGCVDRRSLAASLRQLALCYEHAHYPAWALQWFECTAAVLIAADASLDGSSVAACLREIGLWDPHVLHSREAVQWLERAVDASQTAAEVSGETAVALAITLEHVARCHGNERRRAEAARWSKRAAAVRSRVHPAIR